VIDSCHGLGLGYAHMVTVGVKGLTLALALSDWNALPTDVTSAWTLDGSFEQSFEEIFVL